ncbi:hypothetical protein GC209_11720 [bacterium]|nr:hypothetical protein [bacterium]
MDRLIQMILNRLMGQLINRGIKAGIDHVAAKGKAPEEMSPEERKSAQAARKAGQRAKQAANIAKRMMR